MRNTSAFQPNLSDSLNQGLVSYWKLDESSGNASDSVGSNTGTNTNVTYSTGKINNGAVFNGTSAKLVSTISKGAGDETVSFWFNSGSLSGTRWIFSNWVSPFSFLIYTSSTTLNLSTRNAANTVTLNVSAGTISTGTWYHVAYTRISGSVQWYLNGVATGSAQASANNGWTGNTVIGSTGTSDWFSGTVDEVGWWNRALSAAEITALYNSTAGTTYPLRSYPSSTKAYYPLNGNANDYSGNQNTGTPTDITYPQGRFGQAAKFNGTNSQIGIGTGWSFNNATFTTVVWMRCTETGSTDTRPVLGQGTSQSTNNLLEIGRRASNGKFTCAFYANDLDSNTSVSSKGDWECWIVTYNSSSRERIIYRNGVRDASDTASANFNGSGTVYIGSSKFVTPHYFLGSIDEVIIENRVWTAKEVETYYRKSMLNYKQNIFARFLQSFSISESLSLAETTSALRARNFTTSESLSLAETITALKGISFTIAESLGLVEAYSYARTWVFSIAESLGLVEVKAQVKKKWLNATKTVSSWTNRNKN